MNRNFTKAKINEKALVFIMTSDDERTLSIWDYTISLVPIVEQLELKTKELSIDKFRDRKRLNAEIETSDLLRELNDVLTGRATIDQSIQLTAAAKNHKIYLDINPHRIDYKFTKRASETWTLVDIVSIKKVDLEEFNQSLGNPPFI